MHGLAFHETGLALAVRCNVLQRVAVCCSELQCVAASCSVLQCVAVWCSVMQCVVVVWYNVMQCDAVRCSVLQCAQHTVTLCLRVSDTHTHRHTDCVSHTGEQTHTRVCARYEVFTLLNVQCVAVCCSVLLCVAVYSCWGIHSITLMHPLDRCLQSIVTL